MAHYALPNRIGISALSLPLGPFVSCGRGADGTPIPPATSRRWIRDAILVGVVIALPGPDVSGYRFYNGNTDLPPAAPADAVHWDESVWAPGTMLTWVVAADPGWTAPWTDEAGAGRQPPLASPDQVVPYVAQALKTWSDIESADIRWEVSGVDANLDHAVRGDRRPTIFVDPEAERGSYARLWMEWVAGTWKMVDCDVPLAPFAAAAVATDIWWTYVLIHEFGHCLGLSHAGAYPRINEGRGQDLRGAFGIDPLMSYGAFSGDLVHLAPDDRTGASLLRPAPGWTGTVGGISGVVTAPDDPAPFVQVFAIRFSDGVARGAVGGFTNEEGAFLLAGLEPGPYVVWAGPLNVLGAHGDLLAGGPVLDVGEWALMTPVTVRAGGTTDGIEIVLSRARDGSNLTP